MLQSIRDNITGWIAWVVVILLSVPFALFGINTYFEGRFSNDVARVNGEEITNQEFRDRYQNQYQQIREMFGDQFDPDMIDEDRLRRQVLDQMIEEELLVQRAEAQRYRVSEQEIVNQIQSFEAFQVDGQFSMERYRGLLRAQGMTPSQLERRIERDMKGQLLQNAIVGSSFVTGHEVERMAALENQEREFSELRLSLAEFLDRVEVSDQEIEDYYESHRDDFMTPDEVDLAYIRISIEEISEDIEISEDELRDAWESERERYLEDEERLARHILIQVEDDDEDAARSRAEDILERLRDGESFEDLAREYSADSVSAEEGGSLGWVYPGDMVDEVDEAIFSLSEGELSDVIRSQFGFHLVRVDEIESPEPMPFEEARDELKADMQREEAERRYYDMREILADEAFANPDELNSIADRLEVEIRYQEGVTEDEGEGIASHSRVRRDAFSDMVLNERLNSDPIELDDDSVVVIRVDEHRPAEQRPLEEVSEEIRDRLRTEKAAEAAREHAEALLARLRDGEAMADVAEEEGHGFESPRRVTRNADDLDSRILQRLFRMGRPDNGPLHEIIERDDGDFSIIALHGVDAETVVELNEQERHNRAMSMGQQLGSKEFNVYVRELRRNSDVEVLVDTDDEEDIFGR